MANRSTTGFGLRAAMRLGNTASIQGQSKYAIKSGLGVGIFKNNPASIQLAGDTGYIQDSGFSKRVNSLQGSIEKELFPVFPRFTVVICLISTISKTEGH